MKSSTESIGSLFNNYKNFNINKGQVKVVNENSPYRIKYPENVQSKITIAETSDSISVTLKEELPEVTITVNTYGLNECNVRLGAGNMTTIGVCPKAKYSVGSGNLYAEVNKTNTGIVTGHVGTGTLTNKSNLDKADVQPQNTMFFGNFFPGMNMNFMQTSIKLLGEFENVYEADFDVTTGCLNFF